MVTNDVLWPAEPHTKAKHELYSHYLSKWMPIMIQGKWNGDVTYAEGFAGPGIYLNDDAPGSPIIAFRTIRDDENLRIAQRRRSKPLRMLFVEKDRARSERLVAELTKASHPLPLNELPARANLRVEVRRGSCEPDLERLLTQHQCWGKPILAVLDTWGSSVPIDLVRRIGHNPSSEVLITIQPQFFSRFANVTDITHGDKVFGGTWWREVANQPSDRKTRWLIERYREVIREAGFTHVLDFELIDTRGASLYLIFGTSHDRGLQKMKEAMWEVDSTTGSGYRDPRDPDQQTLEIEDMPQTDALRRLIRQRLQTLPEHHDTVWSLRRWAFYETVYKESQVQPVVDLMVARGQLVEISRNSSFRTVVGLP
ncbi:three-Cys-motif partner protein TcmP [Cellulosimicrobium aquatile]|uniref:three-Cys-motif partner protein TcmP n=1 Tax=Cellulosimicrobium aquatile TaxID=1612203 RepID=UPI001459CCCE|nr:three-Cys-motif partner protein TcmP [Cellulosimicrobium aquatile]NMF29244.1 three-Cys-motif partner protein TcmP [Cellulosimicrobium aquatile]